MRGRGGGVASLEGRDHLGVDFVSMTMSFPADFSTAVKCSNLGPFLCGWVVREDRRPQTQTHSSSQVSLGHLGHEDDSWVLTVFYEFRRVGVLDSTDVSCKFNDGNLESQADSQVRHTIFSCPLSGNDHAFSSSYTKPTRNNNSLCAAKRGSCFVEFDWVLFFSLWLQVR